MPNKRHPARKFIGFWATAFVKDSLQKDALKQQIPLSVLMADILHDYLLKNRHGKGRYRKKSNLGPKGEKSTKLKLLEASSMITIL